jgi:hypothetical protein
MTPTSNISSTRPRILLVGAAYGGLSAVTNISNLSSGCKQLESPIQPPEMKGVPRNKPEITILDERDGICMLGLNERLLPGG